MYTFFFVFAVLYFKHFTLTTFCIHTWRNKKTVEKLRLEKIQIPICKVNMLTEAIQEAVVPRTNVNQVSPWASQFLYEVHSNFVINCGTLYLFIQDIFFRRMLHIEELVKFWFRLTMRECVTSSSIFQPNIKGYWLQVFHIREKCLAIVWAVIKFQLYLWGREFWLKPIISRWFIWMVKGYQRYSHAMGTWYSIIEIPSSCI